MSKPSASPRDAVPEAAAPFRSLKRWAAFLLLLAAALVAAFAMLAWLQEDSVLFQPFDDPRENWDVGRFPFEAQEVEFESSDGVRIHAWWAPPPDGNAPVLVWSHGNAGNLSHRSDGFALLRGQGLGVLLYDYRGYGKSGKAKPSEAGLYLDAEAAWDFVAKEKGVAPGRIVPYGVSLGAGVATELATRRPESPGLILQTPFASVPAMAQALLGLPVGMMLKNKFDNLAKIPGLGRPLLIVHGDRDEVVPYAQGRQLFDAAAQPKDFYVVQGAGHNDIWVRDPRGVSAAIAAFAKGLLPKASAPPSEG